MSVIDDRVGDEDVDVAPSAGRAHLVGDGVSAARVTNDERQIRTHPSERQRGLAADAAARARHHDALALHLVRHPHGPIRFVLPSPESVVAVERA